jgi:biopolymer transport protein ExbD
MRHRTLRKLILDLTPLIDMITILMFGVMIHAVELSRLAEEGVKGELTDSKRAADAALTRSEADRKVLAEVSERARYLAENKEILENRLAELQERIGRSEEQLRQLQAQINQERQAVAAALAKLLDGLDAEKLKQLLGDQDVSRAASRKLLDALKDAERNPASAYKAVRRIEEMEKVFTFIDLHLDANDVLHLSMNGQKLPALPARNLSATDVENKLRDTLQPGDFSQIVLFMFSNEGQARNFAVEQVDRGIRDLRQHYELRFSPQGKQFRYAPVGIVETAPVTLDKARVP